MYNRPNYIPFCGLLIWNTILNFAYALALKRERRVREGANKRAFDLISGETGDSSKCAICLRLFTVDNNRWLAKREKRD